MPAKGISHCTIPTTIPAMKEHYPTAYGNDKITMKVQSRKG
jgi:hypothetical protein